MHNKFYILHFTFYILLILTSCTTTEPSKSAKLSGVITLLNDTTEVPQQEEDSSGISVALYALATLDTTIVRINNQYPQIGVHINQHTEFDHRFQEPLYTTQTNTDGSFSLKNVSPKTYNLVAYKEGWGWRYVYEISLSDGDNTLAEVMQQSSLNQGSIQQMENLKCKIKNDKSKRQSAIPSEGEESKSSNFTFSILHFKLNRESDSSSHYSSFIIHSSLERSDLSLFPESHISGAQAGSVIVKPFHHLVVDDDVIFLENSYFELQPNSVCRIAGGKKVDIYGSVKMQGEEDGMFLVTVDGFYDEFTKNSYSLTVDEKYYSIIFNNDANIYNGIFDKGNSGNSFQADYININSCIFRYCSIPFSITNSQNYNLNRLLIYNNNNPVDFYTNNNVIDLTGSIFMSENINLDIQQVEELSIQNNYFLSVDTGIKFNYEVSCILSNNRFEISEWALFVVRDCNIELFDNMICTENGIWAKDTFYGNDPQINAAGNNFFVDGYVVFMAGDASHIIESDYPFSNNYWGTTIIEEIKSKIRDKEYYIENDIIGFGEVIYKPFLESENENVGIQTY